jgi:hypothetical protein
MTSCTLVGVHHARHSRTGAIDGGMDPRRLKTFRGRHRRATRGLPLGPFAWRPEALGRVEHGMAVITMDATQRLGDSHSWRDAHQPQHALKAATMAGLCRRSSAISAVGSGWGARTSSRAPPGRRKLAPRERPHTSSQ